jgi:tRNA G46 methylase TrmB
LRAQSSPVVSNQRYAHERLAEIVHRHLRRPHRAVIADHNKRSYQILTKKLAEQPRALIIDSFCGTGHSSAALAERHPEHLVIGIDKSASRLAKHPRNESDNYLLLQADCEDLWQLMVIDGLKADFHYILYPNPWPKRAHLQRRIHGHPSFGLLSQLGGSLELRSNWQLYVEEFGIAMHLAGHRGIVSRVPESDNDLTLFEQKYRQSGHDLWAYSVRITP